jgi:hypothetical protein
MRHAKGCEAAAHIMTTLSIIITGLLWFLLPAVFTVGFFLWWRRLRHWSFAVLSSATFLIMLAQGLNFVAVNILHFGKTSAEIAARPDTSALLEATIIMNLIVGVLLLVGAFGLVSAARDDLLLDDAKRK